MGNQDAGNNGSINLFVASDSGLAEGTILENNVEIVSGVVSDTASANTTIVIPGEDYYNLSVNKSGPSEVNAGHDFTYTINWSVTGNMTATDVIVTDTLPGNVSFVSATSGYTENGGVLTWHLGDIDATNSADNHGGFEVVLHASTGMSDGDQVVNNAHIESGSLSDDDAASTTIRKSGGGGGGG
ncbi:hypothetical protein COV56_00135, partial [Candidatus Kuenenbacteria bacterium CG11_big_fil_rev_8_21_14_0_20_37_9]